MTTSKTSIVSQIVQSEILTAISRVMQPLLLAAIVGVFTFEASQANSLNELGTRMVVLEKATAPLINAPSITDRLTTIETHSVDATKNRDAEILTLTDQVSELQKTENVILQSLATIIEHLNSIDKSLDHADQANQHNGG